MTDNKFQKLTDRTIERVANYKTDEEAKAFLEGGLDAINLVIRSAEKLLEGFKAYRNALGIFAERYADMDMQKIIEKETTGIKYNPMPTLEEQKEMNKDLAAFADNYALERTDDENVVHDISEAETDDDKFAGESVNWWLDDDEHVIDPDEDPLEDYPL